MYRPRTSPEPRRRKVATLSYKRAPVWVSPVVGRDLDWLPATTRALQTHAAGYGSNIVLEPWRLNDGDAERVFRHDTVILWEATERYQYRGGWPASLGKVVDVITAPGTEPEAILAFDTNVPTIEVSAVKDVVVDAGLPFPCADEPIAPGTNLHSELLNLWE